MELQRLQVPLVRLSSGCRENLVVLSPDDQHRRLVLAEVRLPTRIERRVTSVTEKQIELNLVIPLTIEQELILGRAVGANKFRIFHSIGVLPLRGFVCDQVANGVSFGL